jgi:hypothetical protein
LIGTPQSSISEYNQDQLNIVLSILEVLATLPEEERKGIHLSKPTCPV